MSSSWFGRFKQTFSSVKQTVTSDGVQVTFKVTYPALKTDDDKNSRRELNEDLKTKVYRVVLDYLKRTLKQGDPNNPTMKNGTDMARDELLDALAYDSLTECYYESGGKRVDIPHLKNDPRLSFSTLIGGVWDDNKRKSVGKWSEKGSLISDGTVTVTFVFDLSVVTNQHKLVLKWMEYKNRGNEYYSPLKNTPVFVKITAKNGNTFQLENGTTIIPTNYTDIYTVFRGHLPSEVTPKKYDGKQMEMDMDTYNFYVDISKLPLQSVPQPSVNDKLHEVAPTAAGGRKSTRRRQRTANTHRRIKQRKQSRKNYTRRRKTTRR